MDEEKTFIRKTFIRENLLRLKPNKVVYKMSLLSEILIPIFFLLSPCLFIADEFRRFMLKRFGCICGSTKFYEKLPHLICEKCGRIW